MHRRSSSPTSGAGSHAFTIVELLIVVSIIILLGSLLLVALAKATGTAQETDTRALMRAMVQATASFEEDHGYLPPLLNENRAAVADGFVAGAGARYPLPLDTRLTDAAYHELTFDYYSVTSPAEYLLGYGTTLEDGFGDDPSISGIDDQEIPRLGFRSPGGDGLWGASRNSGGSSGNLYELIERRPVRPEDGGRATVYGPYLELDRTDLLARTNGTRDPITGQFRVFFPGEPGYIDTNPQVIVDYWGKPIEYFRRPYPDYAPSVAFGPGDYNDDGREEPGPRLSDVIRLRPTKIGLGAEADGIPDGNGDTSTTRRIDSADFAYFSAGRDGTYGSVNLVAGGETTTPDTRADRRNDDNIVEVGP